MSVYRYERLSIRDGGDDATVRVRAAAASSIEAYAEVVPRTRRQEAAQQLAGGDYVVVPAEQTTWACARCYGAPQTHAGGGVNDTCLYEPVLLINEAPQPVRQKDPAYTDEDWRQQIGRVLSLLGIEDGVIRRPPVDIIDAIRSKIDNLYSLSQRLGHERDDLRKQVHEAEAQAADDDHSSYTYDASCTKCRDLPKQPDRPEPVDPASVKAGDVVEIEATAAFHRGPVIYQNVNGITVRTPVEGATDVTYLHSELRQRCTVRVLHAAVPEPDPEQVETLARDASKPWGIPDAAAVPVPDAGDDTLRERLAEALTGLPPTAIYSDGTIKVVAEPVLDTLLPIIREHVAEAWDEGFQSGAEWIPSTASGIPIDPPINPYRRGGVDR